MAKITDPDFLTQGTEITFNLAPRTVTLSIAGNLSDDGVRQQAAFSFAKEEFLVDALLKPHPFPWVAIFDEQFEMVEDWTYDNQASENLVRDCGLAYRDGTGSAYGSGVIQAQFIGFDSVFPLNNNAQSGGDQVYVELDEPNGTTQDMYITGQANQLVKIFELGNFDYTNNDIRFFVREPNKTYGFVSFSSLNVPLPMTYKRYPFPLQNGTDIDIVATDTEVDTLALYTNMSITSFAVPQSRTIGGVPFDFDTVINANGGNVQQIWTYVQRQQRLITDIDADATAVADGDTSDVLLELVGATLTTVRSPMWGRVYIDNFDAISTNFIKLEHDASILSFPFSAGLSLIFNQNYVSSTNSDYNLYYRWINKVNDTDIAITAAAGSNCTLTSVTSDFTTLGVGIGDFVALDGFADVQANDIVRVTAAPTATTLQVTSDIGRIFSNEAAGASATVGSKPYGSSQAVLVTNAASAPIQGTISALSISETYDYTNNTDGGRTPNTDAEVVLEAIGDDQAQYNNVFGLIEEADINSVNISGALERVYLNAA